MVSSTYLYKKVSRLIISAVRYDIPSHDLVYGAEDEPGTLESARYLHSLILEAVERGMPAERIVLAGFSQGGTMSILTGLTCEERLGGIGCMSGRTVMREKLKTVRNASKPRDVNAHNPARWSNPTQLQSLYFGATGPKTIWSPMN